MYVGAHLALVFKSYFFGMVIPMVGYGVVSYSVVIRHVFDKNRVVIPTEIEKQTIKSDGIFENWKDALPHLGKPVRVCLVESPDINGVMTGIELSMKGDEISEVYLKVNGTYGMWEYWKCRAKNDN